MPKRASREVRTAILCLLTVVLPGCTPATPTFPPRLAELVKEADRTDYPDLRKVPPRPPSEGGNVQRERLELRLLREARDLRRATRRFRTARGLALEPTAPLPPPAAPRQTAKAPPPPAPVIEPQPPKLIRSGREGDLNELLKWLLERRPIAAPGEEDAT